MGKILILFVAVLLAVWLLPPFVLVLICAAAVCVIWGISRCNSYPRWLERRGIDLLEEKAPGGQRARDKAIAHGYAELIDEDSEDGYVISTKFRDEILDALDKQRILTEDEFQKHCRAAAPRFNADYTSGLVDYLSYRDDLLEVGWEGLYLSKGLVEDCEQVLDEEGASTEVQFAEICAKSVDLRLREQWDDVAEAVLDNMVSCSRAQKIKMEHKPDSSGPPGRFLYVSNTPSSDCKMIKREISLD